MTHLNDLVIAVVREVLEEIGYDSPDTIGAETQLLGGDDGIDSLSLVRIVAELEREAEARFGRRILLADERAMSRRQSPFRTVGTLQEHLAARLAE
jgi:acyl carrier protein